VLDLGSGGGIDPAVKPARGPTGRAIGLDDRRVLTLAMRNAAEAGVTNVSSCGHIESIRCRRRPWTWSSRWYRLARAARGLRESRGCSSRAADEHHRVVADDGLAWRMAGRGCIAGALSSRVAGLAGWV
jgi:hypothetical protein